jgi:hypothetical protein
MNLTPSPEIPASRRVSWTVLLFSAVLTAAALPLAASAPGDGTNEGRGKAAAVAAPSQAAAFQVVRGEDPPATGDLPATAAPFAGEFLRAAEPSSGRAKAMDQPQCTVCLTGYASAQWSGSTGSFHVDAVVNYRSVTTGQMDVKLILTSSVPTWGQTIQYKSFSDAVSLNPLAAGYQYAPLDSGTVNIYASQIPAGTYYQLLYLRENIGGVWYYDDFTLFSKQVVCNGSTCTPVAGCTPDATTMCLVGGRYRITSLWQNQYAGGAISQLYRTTLTDATGAFWLNDSNVYEYLIRINTATDNGRAWISIPTFTDVEFWILVEDMVGGQSRLYHSPAGNRTLIYDPSFFIYP